MKLLRKKKRTASTELKGRKHPNSSNSSGRLRGVVRSKTELYHSD